MIFDTLTILHEIKSKNDTTATIARMQMQQFGGNIKVALTNLT